MESFLVEFCVAWFVGIVLGVLGVKFFLAVILVVFIFFFVLIVKQKMPVTTAIALLFFLGWILGGARGLPSEVCLFTQDAHVVIRKVFKIEEARAQYLVESSIHCSYLVYADRFPLLTQGSNLELHGGNFSWVKDIEGEYKRYGAYLLRKKVDAIWLHPKVSLIINEHKSLPGWRRFVRARVTKLFIEPDAGLILAMLFADKGMVSKDIIRVFRMSGVSHILAISGLHVSLIVGMLYGLSLFFSGKSYVRKSLILTILWSYILFIGVPVSAVRAGLFWTVFILTLQSGLLISLPTVLIIAAVIMVTINPLVLKDVGFQLSFLAVIGIFIISFLTQKEINNIGVIAKIKSLVLVSFGATVITWPLIGYYFGNVSLLGVIANVLVVPLVPLVLFFSLVAILVAQMFFPFGLIFAWVVHRILLWMFLVTRVLSQVPYMFYEDVRISLRFVLCYYVFLCLILIWWFKRKEKGWREIWQ